MIYNFKCEKCGKLIEVAISIKEYDKVKNRQTCPLCNGKLKRVIEWNGIATGEGAGWCGKSTGNAI